MSSIVQATMLDIENTLLYLEERPRIKTLIELLYDDRVKEKKRIQDEELVAHKEYLISVSGKALVTNPHKAEDRPSSPFAIGKAELETFEKEITEGHIDPSIYIVTPVQLHELLTDLNYHPADVETMCNIYCLADRRGFEDSDIRTVLISFSVLLATSCRDYIEIAFRLFDRGPSYLVNKKDLLDIVVLANDTLMYFGDRNLQHQQVVDFVDSIFTSAGKIEGDIYYPDYFDVMTNHPILEMMLSPQFQGRLRDKLFDEEALTTADMTVR